MNICSKFPIMSCGKLLISLSSLASFMAFVCSCLFQGMSLEAALAPSELGGLLRLQILERPNI